MQTVICHVTAQSFSEVVHCLTPVCLCMQKMSQGNLLVCEVIHIILKPGHDTSICFTGNLGYFFHRRFENAGLQGIVDKAINHIAETTSLFNFPFS